MLFYISLSKKLLRKVNAINITCDSRQYINTSTFFVCIRCVFSFKPQLPKIHCVNLIMLFVSERKKYNALYNLKRHQ